MAASYNEGDKNLLSSVQLLLSRLQLLTAMSTFFASTDGLLLGRVGTFVSTDKSIGNVLTHTTLAGALALHASSAVIAYLASFMLVKYSRISVPISEEPANGLPKREPTATPPIGSPQLDHPIISEPLGHKPIARTLESIVTIERVYLRNLFRTRPPPVPLSFFAAAATPGTVTPPELQDAHNLLVRCSALCVTLSFVGLLLALIGIMAFVWTTFTLAAGIFVSVCLIVSLAGACYALR